MSNQPQCFGTLFPGLAALEYNKPLKGHVFTVTVCSAGIGVQSRRITVDHEAWETCQRCPAYRSCYDLSMAKLTFEQAVLSRS